MKRIGLLLSVFFLMLNVFSQEAFHQLVESYSGDVSLNETIKTKPTFECDNGGRKNVLFLMADDFNHWISKIGYYKQAITPNIDALAEKGVLFSDAQSPSPICTPSRNAIWSGYRPHTTKISANEDGFVREKLGFENIVTMNQYFKQNGYFVYGAGKLYHPSQMGSAETDPSNWSEINTHYSGSQGGDIYSWEFPSNNEGGGWKWGAGEFDVETSGDRTLARDVAQLISNYSSSNNAGKPFFIGCGVFRPHLPWTCHKSFWDMYDPDTLDIPSGYQDNDLDDIAGAERQNRHDEIVASGNWKEALRAYLANLSYADSNIGIMLDALAQSEYVDNTVVVFCGDHGWHLGEKERWAKFTHFDQANHTTLIIYDPSAEGNGTMCEKVVSLQDLYPTLIDLTGVPQKEEIEGNVLTPLLENPEREDWNSTVLMTLWGKHYVKTDRWRFIENDDRSQLYNMVDDPYEFTNLYSDSEYMSVVADMRYKIDSIIEIGTTIREHRLSNSQKDKIINQ